MAHEPETLKVNPETGSVTSLCEEPIEQVVIE